MTVASAPASSGQRRLWFLDQMLPGSTRYVISRAFLVSGELDVPALGRAWSAVVQRHEALRTVFRDDVDLGVVQDVLPAGPVEPVVVDVSAAGAREAVAQAQAWLEREATRPFDLELGPLLRTGVVRLGPAASVVWVALHHICCDGTSLGVLFRDLGHAYDMARRGGEIHWATAAGAFRHHAERERSVAASVVEELVERWRALLPETTAIDLPEANPRRPVVGDAGGNVAFTLDAGTTSAVRRLARETQSSPFVVLLAAFGAFLTRITGTSSVVVGVPTQGRSRPEDVETVGFFVNTLPVPVAVRGDTSFRALVDDVRRAWFEARALEALPFERLVEELHPPRVLSRHPIVEVLLSYGGPEASLDLAGARTAPFDVPRHTAQFDLTLVVTDEGRSMPCRVNYNADLLPAAAAEAIAGRFRRFAAGAAGSPDDAVSAVDLLLDVDRAAHAALHARPRGEAAAPPDQTLYGSFLDRATRSPASAAVVCGGEQLTYGALATGASRLARELRALGAGPGTVVAVAAERSCDLVVAIVGVVASGAAYLPVDPGTPAERLRFVLADSAATALVVAGGARPALGGEHTLPLVDVAPLGDSGSRDVAAVDDLARGGDPAYVIYTSGSTGVPKAVVIEHRNVTALLRSTQPLFGFDERDVWTMFHSLAFDFSVWEMWASLLTGGLLVVPTADERSPHAFHALVRRHRVTVLNQTPSAFAQLLETDVAQLDSVRLVILGGEAVTQEGVAAWFAAGHPARLVNMYGITEVTVHATAGDLRAGEPVTLGRPLPGVTVHVLDDAGRPAPVGVPAEAFVGGTGVARGYLGRPALTAERFLPDAYGGRGARLYGSGDRVTLRRDGTIAFVGRSDEQVKVRGYRIEPREVEAAVCSHDGVAAAAVVVREDRPGDRRLVAYVVARSPLGAPGLRDHVAARLPRHAVPSAFVVVDALPLTANGKIDRANLPAPSDRPVGVAGAVAPRDELERGLASIWMEVLGVTELGVRDDFFELGGDSILAMKVINRVRRDLGVDIPLAGVFEASSVEAMAGLVRDLRDERTATGR